MGRSAGVILLWLASLAGCGSAPESSEKSEAGGPARVPARFQQVRGDAVASGERLARVLGCAGCHGADLSGQLWFDEPELGTLYSSNLTRTASDYSDIQLAAAIREGVRHDGSPLWAMPSEIFSRLGEADMAALIAYLRTLEPAGAAHPRLVLRAGGRRAVATGEVKPAPQLVRETVGAGPPAIGERHQWARYMVRATCAECHGLDLAGDPNPTAESSAPPLAIVAAYSRPQFHHLLRTGEPVGGRTLGLMEMVARSRFSRLSDSEVDAIYDYLAALAALAAREE